VMVSWNLNWISGNNNESYSANTSFLFDLSVMNIISLRFDNSGPFFTFQSVNVSQLSYVPQNYSLPPELEKFPINTLLQLLVSNMSEPMQLSLNNLIFAIFGNGAYLLTAIDAGPAFVYQMTSPPVFQNDTLIIEISGEINLSGGSASCGIQHSLPPPVRNYDIEVQLSASAPFCILTELSMDSTQLSFLITESFLSPPIGLLYSFPLYSYSFMIANNSLTISIPPYNFPMGVTIINTTVDYPLKYITMMSFNTTLQTSKISVVFQPENIIVNASVDISSLTADIAPDANTQKIYSQQFANESWMTLLNEVNSFITNNTPECYS